MSRLQLYSTNRSCASARLICNYTVGSWPWRGRRTCSTEFLCQFHSKKKTICQRSSCPRMLGPDGCGGRPCPPQHQHSLICKASATADTGPQLPGWLTAWVWAWLGPLARFYYYYREVLARAALTLGMLVIIRCGHFIPLPGIDPALVPAVASNTAGDRLIKALYGQAGDLPASLFDLGISPFVNASLVLAVALVLPPEAAGLRGLRWLGGLQEARKEGRSGEARLNEASNTLAMAFALYLGLVRAFELEPCAVLAGLGAANGGMFIALTVLSLVAGSAVIHFCASTITAFGLGNGSSLVICASIISEYAATLHTVLSALDSHLLSPGRLAAMLAGYLALVLAAVWLSTSELRLPVVQYASSAPPPPPADGRGGGSGWGGQNSLQELVAQARQLAQKRSLERSQRGGAAAGGSGGGSGGRAASGAGAGGGGPGAAAGVVGGEYFPLQLISSGIMPIVLGGAAYYGLLPKMVEMTAGAGAAAVVGEALAGPLGLLGYGLMVAAMEFLPLGGVNPKEMAEYFAMMNAGLKGVIPGEPTERELRYRLLQCKFWGGTCLGTLAVAAQLYDSACVAVLGTSLGTTSLLIIVGAVLQTARQMEGLLEGPKLQRKLDQEQAAIRSLSLL